MADKSPQEKAWDTMRKQSPAKRASYTKNRKKGQKKARRKRGAIKAWVTRRKN